MIILRLEVNNIFKMYKKLFSLLLCLILVVVGTFIIKYYFKPFLTMIIMIIICTPVYSIMIKAKIPNRIAGALSIISINTLMILIAIYLGNEIFNICKKVYLTNVEWINKFVQDISIALNLDLQNLRIGKGVVSILNDQNIRKGAISTGEGVVAYFIGNICTFFVLVDRRSMVSLIYMLLPEEMILRFKSQKENFTHMITIEGILVLISTLEIIIGFIILNIPNSFMLGVFCGILDILPYVGTIIVFIPIIIYNIIMKNYLIAFGLICLYILVEVIREILEAKFLGEKLDIHPLVILLSIYIGVKIFGILGILVGPMYSILAKEIIYSTD
ncbi:pheromone autoinducer 2 transporter [Clostridium saccharobutylicum]|uniref:Permease n=2 Tax=Clostridium saccharobutylicum TaxID=169679 RepID=U5MNS8_CLOSA|nr:AI-2E family transporter [Clostridium saccharobutylicum]AGX42419.1 permease [Clostridium saccharobutylicum DSM 13864]AQR89701.1 pheromone autoinducer 2 transporter [Clostridium saccharobutylicum]AQR99603.1 pheromone autoinducer 2 transporter [Clostridium saccharobutylicum]AQS09333.1 pheromone autoinducer 2 transporter [Clostridium saccharobutylicum]AQS13589.1 pheromone autoinducer 2 transporter [Clostridium saccharobutylicum]